MLQEAEAALTDLSAGVDLKNVIIRSYQKMTFSLQEEQGIERSSNLTVKEFEHLLISKGFPAVPIHQITSLFEKVRYGELEVSIEDENKVVNLDHDLAGTGPACRMWWRRRAGR